VEVGEVRDPQAGELGRQAGQRELELVEPDPAGLVQSPGDPARRDAGDGREPGANGLGPQTRSFSVTGATETTCRLNFSSDSSRPAATPISCERWRIGML